MKCRSCGKEIPADKHGSCMYCSKECSIQARKSRSKKRYSDLKKNYEEEKRNERILSNLYSVTMLGKPVTLNDLDSYAFNHGFSVKETERDGKVLPVIGIYTYYIDPKTKNLSIWKLNSNQ